MSQISPIRPQIKYNQSLDLSKSEKKTLNLLSPSTKYETNSYYSNKQNFSFVSHSSEFAKRLNSTSSKRKKIPEKTPELDIKNIINNNSGLFFDQELCQLDEILQKAYSTILSKKHEKEELIAKEENILLKIMQTEKELEIFLKKKNNLIEEIMHGKILESKYEKELIGFDEKINNKKDKIVEKKKKMAEVIKILEENIGIAKGENDKTLQEFENRKIEHIKELEILKNEVDKEKKEVKEKEILMEKAKKQYEEIKDNEKKRLEKLCNKTKMFMGVIRH